MTHPSPYGWWSDLEHELPWMDDALVGLDASAVIRFANPTASWLLVGADGGPTDVIGRPALDFVHPDDCVSVARALERAGRTEQAVHVLRVGPPGETAREVTAVAQLLTDVTGLRWMVSLRDRAGRRARLTELRQSLRDQELLRAVMAQAQVGVMAVDADGRFVLYNDLMHRYDAPPEGGRFSDAWMRQKQLLRMDGTVLPLEEYPVYRALVSEELVREVEYLAPGPDGERLCRRANGQPLYGRDGRKIGAVVTIQDLTEQRAAEAALRHQAHRDSLTGLANRAYFTSRLDEVVAERKVSARPTGGAADADLAVLFVDLDQFKLVNDGLGHTVGDRVVVEVARRLSSRVRPNDTVARLGGDEFVVLYEEIGGVADAIALAEDLRSVVAAPVDIDGLVLHTTASVGIAFAGGAAATGESLMRDADTAMHVAKEKGRDRWEVFDSGLRESVLRRLEVGKAVRRALDEGNLHVVFQPVMTRGSRYIVGVETLVRCTDPELGVISPAEFIPVAEDLGMIAEIDQWVLDQGCAHARRWSQDCPAVPVWVGCNFSARTVGMSRIDAIVESALARHALAPDRLSIELTETALVSARAETRVALARIRRRGTNVGIDDFGVGYASLTYLREFPVNFIKIDRSFVKDVGIDPQALAIVNALVQLAHGLGLKVTAEGVETEEQERLLGALGCDTLQGFLLSRPVAGEVIDALLHEAAAVVSAARV